MFQQRVLKFKKRGWHQLPWVQALILFHHVHPKRLKNKTQMITLFHEEKLAQLHI